MLYNCISVKNAFAADGTEAAEAADAAFAADVIAWFSSGRTARRDCDAPAAASAMIKIVG
jgi:hypothetical protein